MWKSKKEHTSFTKSFFSKDSPNSPIKSSCQEVLKKDQDHPHTPSQWEGRKGASNKFLEDLFNASSDEEESVSLRVLGI